MSCHTCTFTHMYTCMTPKMFKLVMYIMNVLVSYDAGEFADFEVVL